jgi:hypothetical protein
MSKERILGKIEDKSEEEIDKEMLGKFGFVYISDFMTRADGSIVADKGLGGTYDDVDCELWVDFKNRRVVLYTEGFDLNFLEGDFTKEEEKMYYKLFQETD